MPISLVSASTLPTATPKRCRILTLPSTSCSANSGICSRPQVVLREMLRVLKVGGRLAFSTWPPEHFPGRMFTFLAEHAPPPPPGAEPPAPPALWGDPNVVR